MKKLPRSPNEEADGLVAKGHAFADNGEYKKAMEAYKQAIRIDPDFLVAHISLGGVYVKLDRLDEAIEAFKQAIRIDPDLAVAHYGLGIAYWADSTVSTGLRDVHL